MRPPTLPAPPSLCRRTGEDLLRGWGEDHQQPTWLLACLPALSLAGLGAGRSCQHLYCAHPRAARPSLRRCYDRKTLYSFARHYDSGCAWPGRQPMGGGLTARRSGRQAGSCLRSRTGVALVLFASPLLSALHPFTCCLPTPQRAAARGAVPAPAGGPHLPVRVWGGSPHCGQLASGGRTPCARVHLSARRRRHPCALYSARGFCSMLCGVILRIYCTAPRRRSGSMTLRQIHFASVDLELHARFKPGQVGCGLAAVTIAACLPACLPAAAGRASSAKPPTPVSGLLPRLALATAPPTPFPPLSAPYCKANRRSSTHSPCLP